MLASLTERTPIRPFTADLQTAHDALAVAAAEACGRMSSVPPSGWAIELKRTLVPVDGLHPWVRQTSERLVELINQLAAVERLLDALVWAQSEGATEVTECHPTLSARPVDAHDLKVEGPRHHMVFEVSDMADADHNANDEMNSELRRLGICRCDGPTGTPRRLLAVSEQSAQWLAQGGRPPLASHVGTHGTWIVEYADLPPEVGRQA